MAILEINNISKKFNDDLVVDNISLKIEQGEFFTLLGPSGCGKTTFLNVLASKIVTKGSFHVDHDIHSSNGAFPLPHNDVAFVYQQDSFFPMLSVTETLYIASALRLLFPVHDLNGSKVSSERVNEIISQILSSLSLKHVADNFVGDAAVVANSDDSSLSTRGISGGERKRLAIGCELAGNIFVNNVNNICNCNFKK